MNQIIKDERKVITISPKLTRIAFGVGGRTIASNRLRKLEKIAESNVEPNDEPEYPLNRSQ